MQKAHAHPVSLIIDEYVRIFSAMGFSIATGPEMEEEFYNFDALNVPHDHPARDMQDTFWLSDGRVMRTHTSPVQVREMEKWANKNFENNALAIICPGKVFRNEATDATHEAQFHQVEGLLVGENISIANLKGVLEKFFKELLGEKSKIRMRSSFFPFVEPGLEIDVSCFKCEGKGCNTCKNSGYIEIMGAGMVHPKVLEAAGVDSRRYSGFAFGIGVDRLVMLKYGVSDVRSLYTGDLRIIDQF